MKLRMNMILVEIDINGSMKLYFHQLHCKMQLLNIKKLQQTRFALKTSSLTKLTLDLRETRFGTIK